VNQRIRTVLRIIGIILLTSFTTTLFFAFLTAFLYECARTKLALQVP